MKVLQLTYRVPYPPTDGGAIGIYTITKGLKENGCEIDLVSINTPKHAQPSDAMKDFVANQYDVFVDTSISIIRLLKNIVFSQIPYNVDRFISPKVSDQLVELLQKNTYDFIQIEGTFVAYYIDVIRTQTSTPIIIRPHNIEYVIWERMAINEKNPLKKWFFSHLSKRLKRFEANYYNKADGIAAITPEDEQRLRGLGVTKYIQVVPVGVLLENVLNRPRLQAKENTLFSISALDWAPNIEGLKWFFDEIWLKLIAKKPGIQLHIAGKSTPDWLVQSNYPNTSIHGFVDDAYLFRQEYQLMLVPLLSGGGMRVKIIEGLAENKCIISTSIGAEGVSYTDKKNMVIADTPEEWINAICFYLENETERTSIEKNAGELAKEVYENVAVTKRYIDIYQSISQANEK